MAEAPVLTSRAWKRQVRLAFDAYQPMDNHISEFIVTANADGLTARAPASRRRRLRTPGLCSRVGR